jgi:hypothetical protein
MPCGRIRAIPFHTNTDFTLTSVNFREVNYGLFQTENAVFDMNLNSLFFGSTKIFYIFDPEVFLKNRIQQNSPEFTKKLSVWNLSGRRNES